MNKLKAIWKIICSKYFYLIIADENLKCEQIISKNTDDSRIAGMIQLYWSLYWKTIVNKHN